MSLETPHQSHLRVRMFAAGAALAVIAGATAVVIATTDETTAKPTPAVTAASPKYSNDDPLISRFGTAQTDTSHDGLKLYNGRR
jgi:hypothetical protein